MSPGSRRVSSPVEDSGLAARHELKTGWLSRRLEDRIWCEHVLHLISWLSLRAVDTDSSLSQAEHNEKCFVLFYLHKSKWRFNWTQINKTMRDNVKKSFLWAAQARMSLPTVHSSLSTSENHTEPTGWKVSQFTGIYHMTFHRVPTEQCKIWTLHSSFFGQHREK